jgi:glyoxylase-like metal-dependent hydrolase (beta-lactamase superfamily II)
MPVREVCEGVFQINLGRINAWLFCHEKQSVLVDTGLPAHGRRILSMLLKLSIQPETLDAIFLTHSHLDHSGSARMLSSIGRTRVLIHGADASAVEGKTRLSPTRPDPLGTLVEPLIAWSEKRLFHYQPCQVTPVAEGFSLGGFELVHIPGHTPGQSCLFHEKTGVAFCGDAAVNWGFRLSGPSRMFSIDWEQVRLSQLKLADLDAAWYCFGHGPPLERGAAALRELAERA